MPKTRVELYENSDEMSLIEWQKNRDVLWYSQSEVEQLRKELISKFEGNFNMTGNWAIDRVNSVFDKVLKED